MRSATIVSFSLVGIFIFSATSASESEPPPDNAWCQRNVENAVVCYELGKQYFSGDGVTRDRDIATSLLIAACEGGLANSCTAAGLIHDNRAVAITLFVAGCEGEDASGCYHAGNHYAYGSFVTEDQEQATSLFTAACEAGHAGGCFEASYQFANELGAQEDLARAEALFNDACELVAAAQQEEGIRIVARWGTSTAISLVRACEGEFDPNFSICGQDGFSLCSRPPSMDE